MTPSDANSRASKAASPNALSALRANLYRAVRRGTLLKSLVGNEPFHWVAPNPGIFEFGSGYGRWAVHVPSMSSATTMMCFGLGQDITFEQAVLQRIGCRVAGFDPTPASVAYIQALDPIPGLSLHPMALADRDGSMEFRLPPADVADQVSASASAAYKGSPNVTVPCLTLRSASAICHMPQPDIIKMDIEGAEYAVLNQALDEGVLDGVSQLLVEFHHFLPGLRASQTRQIMARLKASGFCIGWVGRTNHEYLFLRS